MPIEAIDLVAPNAPATVLLSHGYTGSPETMRPWAEYLFDAGFTVRCPLLPGHGTVWQDMNNSGWRDWYREIELGWEKLRADYPDTPTFAMGLSMGGTLITRLAQQRGDHIAGLVLVNPSYRTWRRKAMLAPLITRFGIKSVAGLASDIKKVDAREPGYGRNPLLAFRSLQQLWKLTESELPKVTQPLLVYTSTEDHVVEPENSGLLLAKVSSTDVTAIRLENSYHVATLDNDAEMIFKGSISFMNRLIGGKT
ncbi:MAG: alpha/beta fold hydrolase [Corynebacteriales bacterium]|nr:alpha/beta fold hydrolase [Mycobacteriales bacterium]